MKDFCSLLRRFAWPYKWDVVWSLIFNILSAFLTLFSFAFIIPILQMLFGIDNTHYAYMSMADGSLKEVAVNNFYYYTQQMVAHTGASATLAALAAALVVMTLLKTGTAYLSTFFMVNVRNGVVRDLRNSMYAKILSLPIGFFTNESKGDVMARISGDVQEIQSSIMASIDMLFKNPVTIIVCLIMMIVVSWQLTVFVLVLLPLAGWVMGTVGRKLKRKSLKAQQMWGAALATIEETLGGLRVIKAFNAESVLDRRFRNQTQAYFRLMQGVERRTTMAHPMSELLGTTAIAIVLWFGGSLILSGQSGLDAASFIYYMVIFMMAFGFSIGAQIMMARRNGERQYNEIGPIFYQGIYFLLVLAVIVFAMSLHFSPHLLKNIISSPNIYEAALSYINWRIFGFFFSFIMVMFRAFFVGTTQTKTLTLNSIVMVLSNVVFNYILIFGKFGFPKLGIAGAAIGSSLAELVSVLFFIIYTWRRIDCRKYALNKLPAFQPEILKRILGVSLWTMIQNLLSMSTWLTFFLFVEHLGERALAVTNIIRNVSGIPFMMTMAFAATCGSLVSNLIGAGETQCVQGTIRQHIRIAYAFVIPLLIFFALFPNLILSIYTDIPSLREASVPSLWVLCTGYLIMVPANVYFQSVSGTGNTRTALIMEMSVLVVYVAYITYLILYLRVDVALCWTSEHVYAILTLILCRWYIQKGNWQQKKI